MLRSTSSSSRPHRDACLAQRAKCHKHGIDDIEAQWIARDLLLFGINDARAESFSLKQRLGIGRPKFVMPNAIILSGGLRMKPLRREMIAGYATVPERVQGNQPVLLPWSRGRSSFIAKWADRRGPIDRRDINRMMGTDIHVDEFPRCDSNPLGIEQRSGEDRRAGF